MPTVLRVGPYQFYFYASDVVEPPHVHVKRDQAEAKFWLSPVQYERSRRFPPHELRKIRSLVVANQRRLLEIWYEYFDV